MAIRMQETALCVLIRKECQDTLLCKKNAMQYSMLPFHENMCIYILPMSYIYMHKGSSMHDCLLKASQENNVFL